MTMLARGPGGTGAALPTGATTGQVLQWNGSAWVAATPSATGTTPNATAAAPGLVQLAGDLAGTASAPTVPALTGKADKTALAPVATSGAYSDLTGRPALAPVASSGAYGDLTGRPALAPVASSGAYGDLTGRPALAPVATSGAYGDLTGAPVAGPTVYARGKTAATSRTSTITYTLDPDLQATVGVGTYLVQLVLSIDCGAGGLGLFLGGTAGITGVNVNPEQIAIASTLSVWSSPAGATTITTTAQNLLPVVGTAVIPVTSAGTLGIMWAQYTSNAAASSLRAGSALLLTKVA